MYEKCDGGGMERNKGMYRAKDFAGYKGEHFEIIRDTGKKTKNGAHIWEAKCDCGNMFLIESGKVKRRKSCGCTNVSWTKPTDWTGSVIKGHKVLRKTDKKNKGYIVWESQCQYCGEIKEFPSYYYARERCSCKCEGWKIKYADMIGRKPLPNNQSHVNIIFSHYIRSAQDRNISFELTKEEVRSLIEQECYYCGQKPVERYTAEGCAGKYAWNGIDRVDNTKGYVLDNCVPCCKQCNFSKRDNTLVEFKEWLIRAYEKTILQRG